MLAAFKMSKTLFLTNKNLRRSRDHFETVGTITGQRLMRAKVTHARKNLYFIQRDENWERNLFDQNRWIFVLNIVFQNQLGPSKESKKFENRIFAR